MYGSMKGQPRREVRRSETEMTADLGAAEYRCRDVTLDPMLGSGTTAVVARLLGRRYIGHDLNRDYLDTAWTFANEEGDDASPD